MKKGIENIFSFKDTKKSIIKQRSKIIIDSREKNSMIISYLINKCAEIEIKKLEIGDYVIGGITLERKTINDLINSLKTNRLKNQIKNLQRLDKKAIIIEKNKEEKNYSKINKNVIDGLILSITLHHQIPVLFSSSEEDTSELLIRISQKEKKEPQTNPNKIPKSLTEQKKFVLESFKGIGPKCSERLVKSFPSLRDIFNQEKKELEKVIHKKTVEDLIKILDSTNHQD
jgi:ERCC4-type nuclease